MKIKHNEIEIDSENPFSNCKLDRQKFSNILTGIINSYSEGFVLAINNKWGTGKTTFIKMWQQDLKNKTQIRKLKLLLTAVTRNGEFCCKFTLSFRKNFYL